MQEALLALALSVLGPGPDAAAIAPELVAAVQHRVDGGHAPVTSSPTLDLALVATYVRLESGATIRPRPWSHDARDGQSCGILQLPCGFVARHTLAEQARWWLHCVEESSLADVDSSPARAVHRLELARAMLRGAM